MNFRHWTGHFQRSLDNPLKLSEKPVYYLSPEELSAIKDSIRQFQAGENSDGRAFFAKAEKFLKGNPDKSYLATIKLFIKEEQGHSAMLGKFMAQQGIYELKDHWTDAVFRKLRHLGSMETLISVLLTAEIIAAVYYKALRDATHSPDLKNICRRILVDEDFHIQFQTEFLGRMTRKKSWLRKKLSLLIRTFLMLGTILVVWIEHGKTLRKGGYSFALFFHETMITFHKAQDRIAAWQTEGTKPAFRFKSNFQTA